MRRLGEGVEHALHCAMLLGALPPGAVLPAKALAEFHGLGEAYLLKHLRAMARSGVVESVSGPQGGYRLARPPEETTFLAIVEAVDGPGPAFRCTEIRRRGPGAVDDPCAFAAPCVIHRRMLAAEAAWREALAAQTVADLTAEFGTGVDPRNVALATAWAAPRVRRPGGVGSVP